MREHIVVIDDEALIVKILSRQLGPFSSVYQISTFTSGPVAAKFISECQAGSSEIALVIADQVMPEVSGVDLLEQVHQAFPQSAKILLTGHGSIDVVARALNNAGLDRYFAKPWEEADLLVTVETLLAKRACQRESEHRVADLTHQVARLREQNADLEKRLRMSNEQLQRLSR